EGSDPGPYFQPPLLDQVLHHFVRRIRMNLQLRGQRSYGRKGLPGPKLSTDERLFCGENHLVENGLPRTQVQSHECHYTSVTHVTGGVKRRLTAIVFAVWARWRRQQRKRTSWQAPDQPRPPSVRAR